MNRIYSAICLLLFTPLASAQEFFLADESNFPEGLEVRLTFQKTKRNDLPALVPIADFRRNGEQFSLSSCLLEGDIEAKPKPGNRKKIVPKSIEQSVRCEKYIEDFDDIEDEQLFFSIRRTFKKKNGKTEGKMKFQGSGFHESGMIGDLEKEADILFGESKKKAKGTFKSQRGKEVGPFRLMQTLQNSFYDFFGQHLVSNEKSGIQTRGPFSRFGYAIDQFLNASISISLGYESPGMFAMRGEVSLLKDPKDIDSGIATPETIKARVKEMISKSPKWSLSED